MPGQRGSETRQMTRVLRVRFTDADLTEVRRRASDRGFGVAPFVRAAALDRPLRRRKALPPEVARAIGDVGRVGGLLRQLRDLAHLEGLLAHGDALDETRRAVRSAVDAVLNYFEFEDSSPA